MTKIIKLEAQNIKRLKAIEITPAGNVVVVGGNNGQGKSSTLDSIWYALGGASALPSEPLRQGQTDGYARLSLDNGLTVTRRVMESGNTSLKVETEQGVLKSPQMILDKMVGSISFDPLAFARMEPKRQLETLRQLVGVDTNDLDCKREQTYQERRAVNSKVKEIEAKLDGRKNDPEMPEKEVSVSELMETLSTIEHDWDAYDAKVDKLDDLNDKAGDVKRSILARQKHIADLQVKVKELESGLRTNRTAAKKLDADLGDVTAVKDVLQTAITKVRKQVSEADQVNASIRENQEIINLMDLNNRGVNKSNELTGKLSKIDSEREQRISEAEFPVKGLSFGENGVRFKDIPFEQCSSAEQTRVSVGMALAMNPELKVLLIRDGSLLDEDSFALITKMATVADAQVWIETVSTDADKCAVVIEDGVVKE